MVVDNTDAIVDSTIVVDNTVVEDRLGVGYSAGVVHGTVVVDKTDGVVYGTAVVYGTVVIKETHLVLTRLAVNGAAGVVFYGTEAPEAAMVIDSTACVVHDRTVIAYGRVVVYGTVIAYGTAVTNVAKVVDFYAGGYFEGYSRINNPFFTERNCLDCCNRCIARKCH